MLWVRRLPKGSVTGIPSLTSRLFRASTGLSWLVRRRSADAVEPSRGKPTLSMVPRRAPSEERKRAEMQPCGQGAKAATLRLSVLHRAHENASPLGERTDQASPFSEAGLSGRRCRTGARDGLHLLGGLLIGFAESRDHSERTSRADSRLLALCPRQIALRSGLFEFGAQLGRFVLRCRQSAAGLGGRGICLGNCLLGRSDLALSLGYVLVRDNEHLIVCVDLLNLRSGGCGSFCLCRRLCLSGLRRGPLVLEIRMDLHGPDAEPDRYQDRNTRETSASSRQLVERW